MRARVAGSMILVIVAACGGTSGSATPATPGDDIGPAATGTATSVATLPSDIDNDIDNDDDDSNDIDNDVNNDDDDSNDIDNDVNTRVVSATTMLAAVTATPEGFAPLSPDGSLRAYAQDDELCVVQVETDNVSCVAADRSFMPVRWSPTASHVLIDAGTIFAGVHVHPVSADGIPGPTGLVTEDEPFMGWFGDGSSVLVSAGDRIAAFDVSTGESRDVAPLDVDRFSSSLGGGDWLWFDRRGTAHALDVVSGARQEFPLADFTEVIATDSSGELAVVVDASFVSEFVSEPNEPIVFVADAATGMAIELFPPGADLFPRDVGLTPDGSLVLALWSGVSGDHTVVTAATIDRQEGSADEWVEVARLDEGAVFLGWGVDNPMVWPTENTARVVDQAGSVIEITLSW